MNADTDTCYACTAPATTKEHAPPSCFFPPGHRDNLITVPSCEAHNNAKSTDDEYVRTVISTWFGNNQLGEQHFADKAIRSFDRRPALLHTAFPDIKPMQVQGQTVGVYTVDTERVDNVMASCVRALHFRQTRERVSDWAIVLPYMGFNSRKMTPEQAGN